MGLNWLKQLIIKAIQFGGVSALIAGANAFSAYVNSGKPIFSQEYILTAFALVFSAAAIAFWNDGIAPILEGFKEKGTQAGMVKKSSWRFW